MQASPIPTPDGYQKTPTKHPEGKSLHENTTITTDPYKGFLHAEVYTRSDLALPVTIIARKMCAPTKRHMPIEKIVLRYIGGTTEQDLSYPSHPVK